MKKKGFGFSIIEIVIALTILAVLSALAVQRYSKSIQKIEAESQITETLQFFKLAQSYAISLNKPVSVSLNITENRFKGLSLLKTNIEKTRLNTLEINTPLSVTSNFAISSILFSPTQPIKAFFQETDLGISNNLTLIFQNASSGSSNIVIFYETGEAQITQ